MKYSDILLVLVSSAGLLHGVLFAFHLLVFKKKKVLSNQLLGLILLFMAFRIGKSVILYFGDGLEPVFIFIGLAFLLLIGPLLRWYVLSMMDPDFLLTRRRLLEFLPFTVFFIASLFVNNEWYENSKWVVIVFSSGLLFIYLHLAFYIVMSWKVYMAAKKEQGKNVPTKSQKAVLSWLKPLIIGFGIIWISYVLNILDETVPYVIGPIMYSIVIYYLSFKAFQLKATDLDGRVFKSNKNILLFKEITELIEGDKLYLQSDLSLAMLSDKLGKSAQQISSAINQYAQRNFNDYINYYRVQEAKRLLLDAESEKYTIASIAFDTGFSSLSSFNSAFKKFERRTPSSFRNK